MEQVQMDVGRKAGTGIEATDVRCGRREDYGSFYVTHDHRKRKRDTEEGRGKEFC
jgi:hypothetical protein